MKCPKCDFEQPEGSLDCMKCGIVFAKYEAAQPQTISEHPPAGDDIDTDHSESAFEANNDPADTSLPFLTRIRQLIFGSSSQTVKQKRRRRFILKHIVACVASLVFAVYNYISGNTEMCLFLSLVAGVFLLPLVWRLFVKKTDSTTMHWAFSVIDQTVQKSFYIALPIVIISFLFANVAVSSILFNHEYEVVYIVKKDRFKWKPMYILDIMNTGSEIQQTIDITFLLDKVPYSVTGLNVYYKRYKSGLDVTAPAVSTFCSPDPFIDDYWHFSDHDRLLVKEDDRDGSCENRRVLFIENLEPSVKMKMVITFDRRKHYDPDVLDEISLDIKAEGKVVKSHPEFTCYAKSIANLFPF
jgi:hypothetical protein